MEIRLRAPRPIRVRLAGGIPRIEIQRLGVAAKTARYGRVGIVAVAFAVRGVFARRGLAGARWGGVSRGGLSGVGAEGAVRVGGRGRVGVKGALLLRRRFCSSGLMRVLLLFVVDALLRDIRGVRVAEVGVFGVVIPIRFSVQPTHSSGFLVPVSAHVVVMSVLVSPRYLPLAPSSLQPTLHEYPLVIPIHFPNHAPATQLRRLRRPTKRRPIRALAPQNRTLVIVPVALAPAEAAVLRPEEEPDAGEHHSDTDEAEEREDASVVYVVRVEGAAAGRGVGGWGGGIASCEVRTCFYGREGAGALGKALAGRASFEAERRARGVRLNG